MSSLNRVLLLIFALALIGLFWIIYARIDEIQPTYLQYFSLIGSLASFFGLVVIVIQVASLQTISSITSNTAQQTRNDLTRLLFASDLSRLVKIAYGIQIYNRLSKFELSIIRMQELKAGLINIKSNALLSNFVNIDKCSSHISTLSIHITSAEKALKSAKDTLNIMKLNSCLEDIADDLNELDVRVKHGGGKLNG